MKPRPIRTHHDEWVKRALALWLKDLGETQLDARVAGESRRVDVLYTERHNRPAIRRRLGTLGQLARHKVLFEHFSSPPSAFDFKSCLLKAGELEAHERRAARRATRPLSSVVGPRLCIVMPSLSRAFGSLVGARRMVEASRGLYTLPPLFNTVLVVADKLPKDRSTLWLRLLGRGKVQLAAVKELAALGGREPLKDGTLQLLVAWRQALPPGEFASEDDRELAMNLDKAYEQWERKTLARGHQEGKAEGKAESVLQILTHRGLAVTPSQRRQVLVCGDEAVLDAWLDAAFTVSSTKALLSAPAAYAGSARRVVRSAK